MLLDHFSALVGKAFAEQGLPETLGRVIVADRPDLADYQCNGALQAAKTAGKPPRAVAEGVLVTLKGMPEADFYFSDISLAGPGFINFKIKDSYLSMALDGQSKMDQFGVQAPDKPKTYLIEYISANMGKRMHIGHLRNAMIGDAVRRMVKFKGHKTVTDNHLGDWGLPMGQILSETQRRHPDLPYFDDKKDGTYPEEAPITFEELCEIYPAASQKSKDDPAELARAQEFTAKLQSGEYPGLTALWRYFMKLSLKDMNDKLDAFGVPRFDTYYGESHFQPLIPMVMDDMNAHGVLEEIDGAKGIRVQQETDKFDIPPLIVEKKMGGVTYAATDIATFYQRQKDFDPDVTIILTDFRQELHFVRVYRASKIAGYANKMEFVHLMYGTINDKEGKPYKTRNGATPGFTFLLEMAEQKARERMTEIGLTDKLSPEEFDTTAKQIGLASIKFGDLINYRRSDYVFDLDRFVSFEGKTGPYLQYTVVRLHALLHKAAQQNLHPTGFTVDGDQREAALLMLQFPDVFAAALQDYAPNVLADYLFRVAQSINRFYQNVHILTETDAAKQGAALALLALGARILTQGLDILGISVPKQM